MTWKNLQQPATDPNFMEPFYLKNNQLDVFNITKKQQISSVFAIFRIIREYAK